MPSDDETPAPDQLVIDRAPNGGFVLTEVRLWRDGETRQLLGAYGTKEDLISDLQRILP